MNHDYIVCATRTKSAFETVRGLLPLTDEARNRYANPDSDPRGDWQSVAITAQAGHGTKSQFYMIATPSGRQIDPPSGNCWRFTKERLDELVKDNRIWFGSDGNNVPRQKVFLAEPDEGLTPHTIWTADEVGTTDTAKRELNGQFEGIAVFETPKPVELIRRIIGIGGSPDALVLDFFAGSGTTAEAVLRENVADSGTRRYILVQLPEALNPENKDQRVSADYCDKLGKPRTIAELTKERLRRAGKKIREELTTKNTKKGEGAELFSDGSDTSSAEPFRDLRAFRGSNLPDLGFRVFKLASSNIQAWEPDRENLPQTLEDAIEHLKTDRTEADILFELLLKLGLDLTVPIEQKTIVGKIVHSIGAGTLIVCLAPQIAREEVEPLALGIADWYKALAPVGESTVVFRDSAFADDVAKTNLTAILQQHGLGNVRSL